MERVKKRMIWLAVIFTLVVIGAIAYTIIVTGQQAEELLAPEDGEIVTAFIGDLAASASASGQVLPEREASLALEISGRVEQINVRIGDEVMAGDVLIQLETAALQLDVDNAAENLAIQEANLQKLLEAPSEADIGAAEADIASAQANLADLLAGPTEIEVAATEADLRAAQAVVSSNVAQLNATRDSVTDAQLEAARARVVAAEFDLEQAQDTNERFANKQTDDLLTGAQEELEVARAAYDALLAGPDRNSLNESQANVANAAAQREVSQADLDKLLSGSTQAQIASAEAQLAQAQAALADLTSPPLEEDLAKAEAEIVRAEISLAGAEEMLAKASLIAPFNGVITAVTVSEGEIASGLVVEMVDLDSLSVVLEVDEIDIGTLAVGQPAEITFDSFPDVQIESSVASIAPTANLEAGSNIVTYEVHLGLENRGDVPLRVGLTANASLQTAERTDVLLVPNRAITADRDNGKFFVNRVDGETLEEVEVSIGLRDNVNTQINSGIEEGDSLLIGTEIPRVQFGPDNDEEE